jgi:hypothetical protein
MKMASEKAAVYPKSSGDELPFGREEKLEAYVMRVAARHYEEIGERFGIEPRMAVRLVEAGFKELPTDHRECSALIARIMRQLPKLPRKPPKRIERKPLPKLLNKRPTKE